MNRSMYNALMQKMDEAIRQNSAIEEKIDEQRLLLEQSSTQNHLHPISRPRQGKEMNRSVNVAGYLRKEIETRNERIPNGGRKYLQFPSSVDDDRANRDAIRALEGLLSYYLPDDFGFTSWEKIYTRKPRLCEKIIREASAQQDLKVFSQAAAQWAIRMLVSSKMKTRKRSLRAQEELENVEENIVAEAGQDMQTTIRDVGGETVAASTVPELVVDGKEVTIDEIVEIQQRGLHDSRLNIDNRKTLEFDDYRYAEETMMRSHNELHNLQDIPYTAGITEEEPRNNVVRKITSIRVRGTGRGCAGRTGRIGRAARGNGERGRALIGRGKRGREVGVNAARERAKPTVSGVSSGLATYKSGGKRTMGAKRTKSQSSLKSKRTRYSPEI